MILLANGRLITRDPAGIGYLPDGGVITDGGTIVEVGTTADLRAKYPQAEFVDARGGVIMPGLINAHTHIYSALARGLSIQGYSATNFLNDNAAELGINPSNIVIAGSSAGAIIAMQAEYEICNGTSWTSVLPEGFRYAGVMSFSGAILSREGKVDYRLHSPAPTLMLHGTADELVPYRQIAILHLGFFGGGKLVERFQKFGYNFNMYHFIGYGHEIAASMPTTMDLQKRFLETNVMRGKKRIVEAWISDPDVYKGSGPQSRKELYGK